MGERTRPSLSGIWLKCSGVQRNGNSDIDDSDDGATLVLSDTAFDVTASGWGASAAIYGFERVMSLSGESGQQF